MATSDSTPMQRCSKCGVKKPHTYENFITEKRNTSGLSSLCRECSRAKNTSKRDPVARKKYYLEHIEQEKLNNQRYCAAHKAEIAARTADYRKTDAFKNSKRKHQRKPEVMAVARIRASIHSHIKRSGHTEIITKDLWLNALAYFNGCCAVCGRQLNDLLKTHSAAMDHWQPLSKGGNSSPLNIVPLCHGVNGCNNRKKDKLPEVWLTETYGKRKAKQILARINAYFETVKTV